MMRHHHRKRYSPAEFKAEFKVGDFICGWGTGLVIEITAIGQERFLGKSHHKYYWERVNTMDATQGWIKMERPKWWNNEQKKTVR